ncbi:GumC family protein [Dyadobacter arcticus]|uniref:non-specific protein-tyrosine kinase n=1 Tax=Dyadobacter arcticus TaxID=1078754 RepID=A0ABX0USE0_9BACT|nr:tyrosine-protein kinase [Dyadobacter arcticus]NIJ55333.1 capsular exopolysaccharide synthesis family protein [Dyadobacter arcticus]
MSGSNLEIVATHKGRRESLPVVAILQEAWQNRLWFIFSFLSLLFIAHLILRYTTPQYLISASLLIRDDSRGTDFGDAALLEGLGLSPIKSSVDNEVEILKSRALLEEVIDDLQLHVQYFATGHLKTTEIYDKSPFRLRLLQPEYSLTPATYQIELSGINSYTLSTQNQSFTGTFKDSLLLPQGLAILTRTRFEPSHDDKYSIVVRDKDEILKNFANALSVSASNRMASIVNINITDILPVKGEAILKQLIINYSQASVNDKNRIADSTLAYITENLNEVTAELSAIEKNIEQYRSRNHLTDIAENGRLLLHNSDQYAKEANQQSIRLEIIESLEKYLTENPEHAVPSSLFQQENSFTDLAKKYNEIQLLRKKILATVSESHPSMRPLDSQIVTLKADLRAGIIAQKNELKVSIIALNRFTERFHRQINQIPGKERMLVNYWRQQQVKQELYVYLLKKRVETAISRSSTIANARVIDLPKADKIPVRPNKQLVLMMSGLIGLALPIAIQHLRALFNNKISSKAEIVNSCNVPILAEISHQNDFIAEIFHSNKRSIVAEQFRIFRTNILFIAVAQKCQTILITSGMGGEGKSFIALNLSASLALSGKKVLLIEFDLRKPTLAGTLNLKKSGFTDYLISNQNIEDFLQVSGSDYSFHILTSGQEPPNPAEILCFAKVAEMIHAFKKMYDYIIFDTPPIGLVTDSQLLSSYADISFYVIRQQFTFKDQLEDVAEIFKENRLPKLHLILNGTRQLPDYRYSYGYIEKPPNALMKQIRKLKLNSKTS